jgi:uncharacterized protein (TIGR02996 family)
MVSEEKGFLAALKENPSDATARGAYADWLDEHDRSYEALLQRDKAGISEVYFKLRRKSDGLFSEGSGRKAISWSGRGKAWRKLSDLHGHLKSALRADGKYAGTPGKDLEVVVIEVRPVVATALPVAMEKVRGPYGTVFLVAVPEPLGGAEK